MLAESLENWAKKEQRQGETRLLTKQLQMKFGEVPEWVLQRLEHATSEQMDEWSGNILTANSLEEMFKQ